MQVLTYAYELGPALQFLTDEIEAFADNYTSHMEALYERSGELEKLEEMQQHRDCLNYLQVNMSQVRSSPAVMEHHYTIVTILYFFNVSQISYILTVVFRCDVH